MTENAEQLVEVFRMILLIDGTLVAECKASTTANGILVQTSVNANERFTSDLIGVCDDLSGAIVAMLNQVEDGENETWMTIHPNDDAPVDDIPF